MSDSFGVSKFLEEQVEEVRSDYTAKLKQTLSQEVGSNNIRASGDAISITYKILDQQQQEQGSGGFIDLKPYFANSSKAKPKKDGGWYIKVPVGGQQNTTKMRQAYGRKLWDEISHMDFGSTGGGNADIDRVRKALTGSTNGGGGFLNYDWKSTNITRTQAGSGRYGHYNTFRTVSDKSSPTSWIVGRQGMNNKVSSYDNGEEIAKVLMQIISKTASSIKI